MDGAMLPNTTGFRVGRRERCGGSQIDDSGFQHSVAITPTAISEQDLSWPLH
jgi:hypothetical protein